MYRLYTGLRSRWRPLLTSTVLCLTAMACSSIDLPTVKESDERIRFLDEALAGAEEPLRFYERRYSPQRDLRTTMDVRMLNRMLRAVATQRSDDLRVAFLPTRPLLKERKHVFGVSYVNRLDIDSGLVRVDLRSAEITGLAHGVARMRIDLRGEGQLAVSGRYTGIPARATPRVGLSLNETVTMHIRPGERGGIVLTPSAQTIALHTTFHVNLLGWEIPWKEETQLELDDILAPIHLPDIIAGEISLPRPAREHQTSNVEFEAVPVRLKHASAGTEAGRVVFQGDVVYEGR
ncbi:MAG: hypothetical protein KFH87_13130 [Bacteroidetes bacterium]|nr:hypothetical protein [Bacteroidota bacterium]